MLFTVMRLAKLWQLPLVCDMKELKQRMHPPAVWSGLRVEGSKSVYGLTLELFANYIQLNTVKYCILLITVNYCYNCQIFPVEETLFLQVNTQNEEEFNNCQNLSTSAFIE